MDPEKFDKLKMSSNSERTPLLATVRVAPPQQRRYYNHNIVRRFCAIATASTLAAFFVYFIVVVTFFPVRHHHHHNSYGPHGRVSFEELQEILLSTPQADQAREWSKYYTAGPHLAGANFSQVVWTLEKWKEFGIEQSSIVAYDTYINYPLGHRLALYEKSDDKTDELEVAKANWTVKFEASLEEDVLDEDPTSSLDNRIPTFHGYSASGNVTGQFVYANYGTYQDFEDLLKIGIDFNGKIVLVRYGGIFRGLKVKRAEDLGAIGVVIFTDPGDDGEPTDEHGYDTYPNGPARHPTSVQRGSVQYLSLAPGDPTTPGYPSKPGVPRQPVKGAIPEIPSIPISYVDAIPILKALNGHGPSAKDINKYWTADTGLGYKGVEYNVGPSPEGVVLNLVNEQDYVTTPLWNVIGVINGTISDEVIVIGNHRDAWIAGGAGDPNSGSAALNEVVRAFGKAVAQGWKPLRTLVFASWDGEEYGLIGSTEWVEEYIPWLSGSNVAYVNLDVACTGTEFGAAASPVLNKLIYEVTSRVPSPNQTVHGQSVRDLWNGKIRTMGSGSDFTAFQDFAGVSSVDFGFKGSLESPVYQYHSNYDSFYWMDNYGDPGFKYHEAMAKVYGLFAAMLVDAPIIPFNVTDYAISLKGYIAQAEKKLHTDRVLTYDEEIEVRARPETEIKGSIEDLKVTFKKLEKASEKFEEAAIALDARIAQLTEKLGEDIPWWRWISKIKLFMAIRHVNTKLKLLDRQFLYAPGLDGRSWFKHVIFAPGKWTGYAGAVFPGLTESIDEGDYKNAEKWVGIIEGTILKAAKSLK